MEDRGSWMTTEASEAARSSKPSGIGPPRRPTKANQPQSKGRKVPSSQATGRSRAGASPCGAKSPVARARATSASSSPTTASTSPGPSSWSRASSAAPSPPVAQRRSQPHAASNPASMPGPGPHWATKLS